MPENNNKAAASPPDGHRRDKVTVSIITGRYPENLGRALRSLRQAAESTPLEVYVIDNKAGFDVKEVVQRNYPTVHIIKNVKQQGFGANHNQILKTATSPTIKSGLRCGSAKYILLLNDDIELGSKTIDLMYAFMEQHPDVGLSGSALYEGSWSAPPQTAGGLSVQTPLSPALKTLISSLVRLMGYYRLIRKLIGHQSLAKRFVNEGASLSYISGACMMVRREALQKVGFFDETFYMYLEDVDFGARAIAAGWKCYQVPGAKVLHHGFSSSQPRTYRWIARSAVHYANKYHNVLTRMLIAFLATILRIASSVVAPKHINIDEKLQTVKNILVMRLGGIGDIITATPALRYLKKRFPQSRIALLGERPSVEIIRGAPYIDEIINLPGLFGAQALPFISDIINGRFHTFVEFQSLRNWRTLIKPMLIGYLSRAWVRAGLDTAGRGWFLTHRVPDKMLSTEFIAERLIRVVKQLSSDEITLTAETVDKSTEVFITPSERKYADDFFKQNFTVGKPVVAIHPGGNRSNFIRHTWPAERFIEAVNALVDKYNAEVLLVAGPQEMEYCKNIAAKINGRTIIPHTNIKQVATLIEKSRLFIGNDSGPMHIAVAMKVPAIGIFGSTDWQMNGTYPPETNFIMLHKNIDCWPCRNLKCTSRECMNLITVADVLAAVDRQMTKK